VSPRRLATHVRSLANKAMNPLVVASRRPRVMAGVGRSGGGALNGIDCRGPTG
jgi:hypothetical protein